MSLVEIVWELRFEILADFIFSACVCSHGREFSSRPTIINFNSCENMSFKQNAFSLTWTMLIGCPVIKHGSDKLLFIPSCFTNACYPSKWSGIATKARYICRYTCVVKFILRITTGSHRDAIFLGRGHSRLYKLYQVFWTRKKNMLACSWNISYVLSNVIFWIRYFLSEVSLHRNSS